MTILVYNGVVLRDCETRSFQQEMVMDPSGTDLMFSRFKIRVAATLTPSDAPRESFGVNVPKLRDIPGGSAPDRLQVAHALLSQPRKDFWMVIPDAVQHNSDSPPEYSDRTVLMASGSATGTMPVNPFTPGHSETWMERVAVADTDNGPKPAHVMVKEITGGRTMRVEFEIHVSRRICAGDQEDPKPNLPQWLMLLKPTDKVLSNRWTLEESKDENWVTTRKLRGELRVAHHDFWPHFMRYLCVPPLLRGFRRVGQRFTDDPTGLVLQYEVTDRQEHAAPPYPAIAWSGHHGETTTTNGSIQGADFAIRLVGPPGVDKTQLILAAQKVAIDRIRGLVPEFKTVGMNGDKKVQANGTTIIKSLSVISAISEPTIELRCNVMFAGDLAQPKSFGLRVYSMGRPMDSMARPTQGAPPADPRSSGGGGGDAPQLSEPGPEYKVEGYDSQAWPVPLLYSSETPAGIFACYLQNPCSVWHEVPGISDVPRLEYRTVGRRDNDEDNTAEEEPEESYATVINSEHELPEDETLLKPFDASGEEALPDVLKIATYPYHFVEIESTYQVDTGWAQLPLGRTDPSAGSTCRLIQLHAGTAKRILRVAATRDGTMPMIPKLRRKLTDPNGVREALLNTEVVLKAPEITGTGTNRRYSVQVIAVYAMSRPPDEQDYVRSLFLPYDALAPSDEWARWSDFADQGQVMQSLGATW